MKTHKKILTAAVLLLSLNTAAATIVEGRDYTVLGQPIAQLDTEKTEVSEFFSYSCIHCYHLEADLSAAVKKFPADVYFRRVHVVWNEQMKPLARIAAAVAVSGTGDRADAAVFDVIFKGNNPGLLLQADTFKSWAQARGDWGKALARAYDNKETAALTEKMASLTMKHRIDSTPQIIVAGKYRLTDSRNMKALNELIDKARREKKSGKAGVKAASFNRLGAALSLRANR